MACGLGQSPAQSVCLGMDGVTIFSCCSFLVVYLDLLAPLSAALLEIGQGAPKARTEVELLETLIIRRGA